VAAGGRKILDFIQGISVDNGSILLICDPTFQCAGSILYWQFGNAAAPSACVQSSCFPPLMRSPPMKIELARAVEVNTAG